MTDDDRNDKSVSWCFEPSQPQRITSGLTAMIIMVTTGNYHGNGGDDDDD